MQTLPTPLFVPLGPVPVRRSEILMTAQRTGPLWRVLSGAFRVDFPTASGLSLTHLALPGDWLGTETLCGEPCAFTVTALIDSEVQAETLVNLPRMEALSAVVRQQQRQMIDMLPLRSGPVVERLSHLLGLLARRTDGSSATPSRKDMPRLKQTAELIDSAVETVCREMNRLLPARARRAPGGLPTVWQAAHKDFSRQASKRLQME